jgi:hypothetical protein
MKEERMAGPTPRPQAVDLLSFAEATRALLAIGGPLSLWQKPAWRVEQRVPEARIGKNPVFPRGEFQRWLVTFQARRRPRRSAS